MRMRNPRWARLSLPSALELNVFFHLKRLDATTAFRERLPDGSLLIMAGETQKNFRHEVPKEPKVEEFFSRQP
jgi:alkylated DNA repair dioxygenase AlkB